MEKTNNHLEKSSNHHDQVEDVLAPSHYVGIGASAGGLEAIEEFFKNMSPNSGLAFIVVQHLSPDYKSLMGELLAKHTEMPIYRAEDGMKVETNSIYLIPPKNNLTIFHGKLLLSEQDYTRGVNLPIDIFLKSLADDQGQKSIAIILSGTGSDGTRGVRAIKESGGMVMVQKEDSAKFDGMPRSAIATGLADFILDPWEMPDQLQSFIKHPYAVKSEISDSLLSDDDGLTRIFALLRDKHKIDFTFYKPSTVVRRIERRMTVNQIHELRDYVKYMESYTREVTSLYRELLIGVTSFFRDPEAYQLLAENWIPRMLEETRENQIRLWVPACSTGEEAYSLAILCKEAMSKIDRALDVKIFATDIDNEAIQRAGAGIYPESITADLSPKLLTKYFFKHDDSSFHISRTIREMVVFANQNIIKDPPFTNISLVSCRNLLIYLQPVLQKKVLELINFSLVPDGVLFLGTSETIGDLTDYFEPVDHRWKIYISKGRQKRTPGRTSIDTSFDSGRSKRLTPIGRPPAMRMHEEERILDRVLQSLADQFFTCAFVVNDQGELVHVVGNAEGFLRVPSGKLQNDISRIAVKDLSIPLLTGVQRVLKAREDIVYSNIRIKRNDAAVTVRMRLTPLQEKRSQESLVLILIEEVKEDRKEKDPTTSATYDIGVEAEQRIGDLEHELQFTKENLQATIEELETSNEELQATNEELLASNEELQSTNEELQSVNEELYTVNAEHQKKIMELTEANNDVNNLLSSSNVAKLFLDENYDIRIFTSRATSIFKVLQSDIGRPFTHISHNLKEPDLFEDIKKVNNTSQTIKKEVQTEQGDWYLMRILPYYVAPEVTSGVVMTFTDVNDLKQAQEKINHQMEELRKSEEKYRTLFETMALGVVYQGADGKIQDANPAAQRILGLTLDQMQGRTSTDPRWKAIREDGSDFPGDTHPAMVALQTGKTVNDVLMGVFHPEKNENRWIIINAVPQFRDGEDKPFQVFATFDDVTELKNKQKQYQLLFDTMMDGFAYHKIITDDAGNPIDYIFLDVNPAFEKLTGLKREEVLHRRITEVLPGVKEDEFDWIAAYGKVAVKGEMLDISQYSAPLEKWYRVRAYSPDKGYFVTLFQPIDPS